MDRAARCRVVDVFEHVQGLDCLAESGQGAGEAGRGRAALQSAQDRRGEDDAGAQRGGELADLVPMLGDEPRVDVVTRQPVERAVAGVAVDPPQPQAGQVGQPRCPPVAQRPRKSEDDFGGAGGVGGDHLGPDAGLVRDEPVENIQAVTLCAGDRLRPSPRRPRPGPAGGACGSRPAGRSRRRGWPSAGNCARPSSAVHGKEAGRFRRRPG